MRQGLMALSDGLSSFSSKALCTLQVTPPDSGMHFAPSVLIVLPANVVVGEYLLRRLLLGKTSSYAGFFYFFRSW